MINQVVPNSVSKRTFCDFSQSGNGWYLAEHPKNKEEKQKKKYGKTIVGVSLLAGFGLLALGKGSLGKAFSKYAEKLKVYLEKRIDKGGKLQGFYRFSVKKLNSFMEKSESINNLTTLKDVLLQKLMFKNKFTRKIHEGITAIFNKISRKTVNRAYGVTHRKFAYLNEYFLSVNDDILRQHPNDKKVKAIIDSINERIVKVNNALTKGFGINARNQRLKTMDEATEKLFDYFWDSSFKDIKNFRSKRMYQTFIAEEHIHPFKMQISNEIALLRSQITHSITDNYKATLKAIENIQKCVNPLDTETNKLISTLKSNLENYKKLSGENEKTQRMELNQKIISNLKKLGEKYEAQAKTQGYSTEDVKTITKYIKDVNNIISDNSTGELQEILMSYKKLLSKKEFLRMKSKIHAAVTSLDNSINIETIKYMDKYRDLKLGSAPTDIISIIGAVGTVGWFLGKAKNKDEKISSSLKYGIPAIGGIATSLYCTARLVSGGKALFFGLLSSWLMNKAGVLVDDLRKQYAVDFSIQNKTKLQSDKV